MVKVMPENASPLNIRLRPPEARPEEPELLEPVFSLQGVSVSYSGRPAIRDITMEIPRSQITAIIGPSGCGKSTLIRTLNRMNDLVPGAGVTGKVLYHGQDIYDPQVDPVELRRRIGMVFQKPNPFPKSIYENVAFGLRVNRIKDEIDDRVEAALKAAALWDEVKHHLRKSAYELSGGQQQRLCIARAIAVEPDAIVMDEPASALDPIATAKIETLMADIKQQYSIVIVTHNMQQAARVSDVTAFLTTETAEEGHDRTGILVEYDRTDKIFTMPSDARTEAYITGRFG